MLVLSLGLMFTAAPVAADDDEFSAYATPEAGVDGDWFMSEDFQGIGPIARAIDDTIYAASGIATLGRNNVEATSSSVWSTAPLSVGAAPPSGTYAALLTQGASAVTNSIYVELVPPAGITYALFEIPIIAGTEQYSFYQAQQVVTGNLAQMELYFSEPSSAGTDYFTINYMQHNATGSLTWGIRDLDEQAVAWQYWGPTIGSNAGVVNQNFANLIADTGSGGAELDDTTWDAYELTRVRVELNESSPARYSYIDDIEIDGVTYDLEATELFKSADGGHSWEATYYSDATDGVVGDAIVDIVCSTVDADVVYVADNDHVYKTEDGGDSWAEGGDYLSARANTEDILCMGVGWDEDDDPRVFVGTDAGNVWYLYDVVFGADFTDLVLDSPATPVNVWGFGISPDFNDDAFQAVLVNDADETFIAYHIGSDPEGWSSVEILDADAANFPSTGGSNPVFPEDFNGDDFYDEQTELFVGAAGGDGAALDDLGGVWRVYGVDAGDEEVLDNSDLDVNIASLAIVGTLGDTQLLAGEDGDNDVWYSWDDGDDFDQASAEGINPAGGAFDTHVLMDALFDEDEGIGWAATSGLECGLHGTIDGGTSWQGFGLLDTDILELRAVEVIVSSPEMVYIVTEDDSGNTSEVFRWDESNWERIYEELLYTTALGVMNAIGVYGDTIVLYDFGTTNMASSDDGGQIFAEPNEPGVNISCLLLVDEDTWWVGTEAGDLEINYTAGGRSWDTAIAVDDVSSDITSLAVRGDEAIAGTIDGEVYYSDDEGLAGTWDQVGADLTGTEDTYVCFDTDNTDVIYAASAAVIARFQYLTTDLEEVWEEYAEPLNFANAYGIACLDGVLYASSLDTVNATAGAITRISNPLYDLTDITLSDVDYVSTGLTNGTDAFDGGMLVTASSPNVIWGWDIDLFILWTYTDLMVGPVTGGVADPDTADFMLTWDGFDNATGYEVWVYSDEDMTDAHECEADDTASSSANLWVDAANSTGRDPTAGTQYWWQVRGSVPVHSKWSEVFTFTTGAGALSIDEDEFAPALGATDVSTTPSFGWSNLEVDSYVFEFSDTANFSTLIESAEVADPTYNLMATLSHNTNYFFRVKAVVGTAEGPWAYGTFTTRVAPEVAPTPPAPAPAAPAPILEIPIPPTPNYIYAIIGIGAALAILVIVLIVKTRGQKG